MKKYQNKLIENNQFKIELSLSQGNVQKAIELLRDLSISFKQEYSNIIIFKNKKDFDEITTIFEKQKIEYWPIK
jgi:hypothetical protein